MDTRLNKLIIDTDLGDDIDDMWAIGFAALAGFDIRLITVCYADIEYKLKCAQYMKDALKLECAIAGGVEKARTHTPHAQRVKNVKCDVSPLAAEDAIAEAVGKNAFTDIAAIGPMTNVGAFVKKYPALKDRCRIVCMGGSVYKGIYGVDRAHAEYNLKSDRDASAAVLESGFTVVYAPLDVNRDFIIDGARYRRLRTAKNPVTQKLLALYDEWQLNYHGYSIKFDSAVSTAIQYDTTPLLYILDKTLYDMDCGRYGIDRAGKLGKTDNGHEACVLLGIDREKALDAALDIFMREGYEH
ncbi:MAG: nucleoside hydrolase [Clostridiales bacterium]|jgi:inosine-uridine nucleoside N-ribohydrolase|nr:nucleoside hydrolase [Clostridiales bacterium]